MAIDHDLYSATAIRGDVAGPVIQIISALSAVVGALEAQANGADIAPHLKVVKDMISELNQRFDDLTGWTSE